MPLGKSGKHFFNPKVMEAHGDAPDAVPPIPEEHDQQQSQPEMVQCPSCGAEFPLPPDDEQAEGEMPVVDSKKMASPNDGAY